MRYSSSDQIGTNGDIWRHMTTYGDICIAPRNGGGPSCRTIAFAPLQWESNCILIQVFQHIERSLEGGIGCHLYETGTAPPMESDRSLSLVLPSKRAPELLQKAFSDRRKTLILVPDQVQPVKNGRHPGFSVEPTRPVGHLLDRGAYHNHYVIRMTFI